MIILGSIILLAIGMGTGLIFWIRRGGRVNDNATIMSKTRGGESKNLTRSLLGNHNFGFQGKNKNKKNIWE